MATIKYWIQIENRPWDVCPNNIDRITGQNLKDREGKDPELNVQLTSLGTPVHTRKTTMFRPLRDDAGKVKDALILRRYKPPQLPDQSDAWTVPDDRKLNPWDLNEPDPTDNGTMGTIPGPVIECSVGDDVIVHYRNMDMRGSIVLDKICFPFPFVGEICLPFPKFVNLPIEQRTHSLHPHGFVFAPQHDGAYPLSPPDPTQPIPASQAAAWASVPGFSGSLKKGDRVPPGGTFTYHWNTFGWPTTAGVWLYHDHSICDMDNTELGAIGFIVIHNPADINNEVDIRLPADANGTGGTEPDPQFLPGGSPVGSPRHLVCFPFPHGLGAQVLPHDLEGLGDLGEAVLEHGGGMHDPSTPMMMEEHAQGDKKDTKIGPPVLARAIRRGDLVFELDKDLKKFIRLCHLEYQKPPAKALYLQLFHTMGEVGMCINGRKYLGNTPTMIAGPHTRMRFGVVGMGSDFHTFHIHGHRWALPGPHGNTPVAIQGSPQDTPVSQFEDTRTFGPANSFVFTIEEGSGFMRADPFTPGSPVGEWHMHCHVLMHMGQGMMGSLLVINENGGPALALPKGVPCEMPKMGGGGGGQTQTVVVKNFSFTPATLNVHVGDQVIFDFQEANHTVHTLNAVNATGIEINNGNSTTAVIPIPTQRTVTIAGSVGGRIDYECGIHHAPMLGTINIT